MEGKRLYQDTKARESLLKYTAEEGRPGPSESITQLSERRQNWRER